jgi:hypothetical protein
VFLKIEIEDFYLQKHARPDRFIQKASFERSEKQPVVDNAQIIYKK